jgi:hypothetical protein
MKSRLTFGLLAFGAFVGLRPVAAQSPTGGAAGPSVDLLRDQVAVQEAARRDELVSAVLSAREAAAGRKLSAELRASLGAKLSAVPVASLETFAGAGGLGNIDSLVQETVGSKVLGDSAGDLVFTPVTPCRIVNTVATATPLAANTTRTFFVNGSTAGVFEAQGGNAGGCGIPDTATSVEMNFIAVAPAAAGDFRAFPWSATPTAPLASVINYANVPGLNIANGLAQPVCNAAVTTCTSDLIVQADAGQSHLIIDVVGYYAKVDKTQIRTFSVSQATGFGGNVAIPASGCSNYAAANITITAPVAGKVLVRANLGVTLSHTTGSQNDLYANLASTATDCVQAYGYRNYWVLSSPEPTGTYYQMIPLSNIFTVAAGANTFYLNAQHTGGTGTHSFQFAGVDATFIPN